MSNPFRRFAELGQSLWYDNIRRGMLESGQMQALRDEGILGLTSNPTIFHKAITATGDYDATLAALARAGKSAEEVYEALVLEDIGRAADLFRPVYDRTHGHDGYVSIEVEPALADDTQGTLRRAREIFARLNRPNVMVKVPATEAGLPAIAALIAEGVNVNVTLIFSLDVYSRVIDAYMTGLETRLRNGRDLASVASVASFFVSRLDTLVDPKLQARIDAGQTELRPWLGRAAVACAQLAYVRYKEAFGRPRFAALQARGARVQRPLWASTSTKNPAYRETIYVDTLIGRDTVNTVPHVTLDAIRRLDRIEPTLERDVEDAREVIDRLDRAGIPMNEVTEELRTAGVKAFADSFDALMKDLQQRTENREVRTLIND